MGKLIPPMRRGGLKPPTPSPVRKEGDPIGKPRTQPPTDNLIQRGGDPTPLVLLAVLITALITYIIYHAKI